MCVTHMCAHVTLKLLPKKWRVVDATRCSSRLADCALSADDKYTDKLAPLVHMSIHTHTQSLVSEHYERFL